jgi:hypothetical protein
VLLVFIIFEINVYSDASQQASSEFTPLEIVSARLHYCITILLSHVTPRMSHVTRHTSHVTRRTLPPLTPPLQVQFIFAIAMVVITLLYQIALGIPPNDKTLGGIPVKFRIHNPALFEEASHNLLCSCIM